MESIPNTATALAYLTSIMPALSETFIYREIFELERRGYRLHLYAIHRPDRAMLSAEALPLFDRTSYLLPVGLSELISAHAYYACVHPLRYFIALWRMLIPFHHRFRDRVRSLLHFCEGAVVSRKMQKAGVTLVHSHYASNPASVARVVYLLTGIPYSISAHAVDIWHDRLLLREKLAEARFVACCSCFGRAELIRQGHPLHASKVYVVYHGIDTRRFVPPENGRRNQNLILSVGRLDPIKGFADLISACFELDEQGVNFTCEIVGEGPERENLAALIDKYRLNARVCLKGLVPQEKLLSYYQRATIFVLPCVRIQGTQFDGIPNVLLEAMAMGLPVVSTTVSGIPELIESEKDGFLVPSGNPRELARWMAYLLEDASVRQRVGAEARAKAVRRFDNRRTIEPLLGLFRSACSPCESQ